MKWPLGNSGATYLKDVIDTVQTVQFTVTFSVQNIHSRPPRQPLRKLLDYSKTTKSITFDLSSG